MVASVLRSPAKPGERTRMKPEDRVIEGTARDVIAQLAHLPAGARVRAMVGRPSLSVIARRLQATAAANGMTAETHDNLLRSLTNDG
jgi:hypothetical protein